MGDRWFFSRDDKKCGPFSDRQLKDLADLGKILPTDTVWREGTERGVTASNVKNLFPSANETSASVEADLPNTKVDAPDGWYYGPAGSRTGPFSDRQLRDLADAGKIMPTDTVWKVGVEQGVVATKVKNLFPPSDDDSNAVDTGSPTAEAEELAQTPAEASSSDNRNAPSDGEPQEAASALAYRPSVQPEQAPKKRAVAGKGTTIVGQDGANVKIRKKCTVCGYEDSCWHTMRITVGMNKATFFCRNCRRTRQVEFRGFAK